MSNNTEADNRAKKRVACLSVCSNTVLTLLKLIVGFITGSVSILSEGIHSGMDLFASVIALFSVRKSSQPPDKDHQYGHGKYEDASGIIEALLIVAAGAVIIWEAVSKLIFHETPESFDKLYLGIILMLFAAVVNLIVSTCLMRVGKRTESIALESDAWHLRTDVLTSAGVAVGLILIYITGINWLDSVIAIIVALFILWEGLKLVRRTFRNLMDASLTDEEIAKIEEIIARHKETYTHYHDLKTRRAGPDKFVEFTIVLPRTMPFVSAHEITDHIEKELRSEINRCTIIIHFDPCDGRCSQNQCTFICREARYLDSPKKNE